VIAANNMRVEIEIQDELVADLASFQGNESLTGDELASLVYQTIVEKAYQFVQLNTDAKIAQLQQSIVQQAIVRKEEIAQGITVQCE